MRATCKPTKWFCDIFKVIEHNAIELYWHKNIADHQIINVDSNRPISIFLTPLAIFSDCLRMASQHIYPALLLAYVVHDFVSSAGGLSTQKRGWQGSVLNGAYGMRLPPSQMIICSNSGVSPFQGL